MHNSKIGDSSEFLCISLTLRSFVVSCLCHALNSVSGNDSINWINLVDTWKLWYIAQVISFSSQSPGSSSLENRFLYPGNDWE